MVRWCHLISSHNIIDVVAFASSESIIRLAGVIKIEKALHPLAHFKVVLILGLDELVYLDVLLDTVLVEGRL